jgi:lipopolysaccharide assembly protein B
MFVQCLVVLLPVAAGCGWFWRGKTDGKDSKGLYSETRDYYFRGLNHIINEEADKAVDAFIKLIEVDADTVETHLALGNLFRRRGEVDRAIRIHNNLMSRPEISDSIKMLAYTALVQDYLEAGVLDRAEDLCLHLIEKGSKNHDIPRFLLKVYEKEKAWLKAIEVAKSINKSGVTTLNHDIANYFSELADDMYQLGQYDQMQEYLDQALNFDSACVRVHYLKAKINMQRKRFENALLDCREIEGAAVSLLGYLIPALLEYKPLMETGFYEKVVDYTNNIICDYPFLFFLFTTNEKFDLKLINKKTFSALFSYVKETSSLERIHYFLCYQQRNSSGDALLQAVQLRGYLDQLVGEHLIHQCSYCGFKTNILFWCCPGCDKWSTAIRRSFLLTMNDDRKKT